MYLVTLKNIFLQVATRWELELFLGIGMFTRWGKKNVNCFLHKFIDKTNRRYSEILWFTDKKKYFTYIYFVYFMFVNLLLLWRLKKGQRFKLAINKMFSIYAIINVVRLSRKKCNKRKLENIKFWSIKFKNFVVIIATHKVMKISNMEFLLKYQLQKTEFNN